MLEKKIWKTKKEINYRFLRVDFLYREIRKRNKRIRDNEEKNKDRKEEREKLFYCKKKREERNGNKKKKK